VSGPFNLVGVTVSLEVSDASYGTGTKHYAAFKAETPAWARDFADQPTASLDEALAASLDLHLAAFESVYAAIVAAGGIPVEDYNKRRASFKSRRAAIAAIFAKHPITPTEDTHAD
jgi:hypothetical protein